MRKNILFGALGLGIAGLFMAGPIANAGQPNTLTLDKSSYVAGEEVTFGGKCHMSPWVKDYVKSPVLAEGHIGIDGTREAPLLTGKGKIKKDAKPGTYTVSYDCGPENVRAKLTIVSSAKPKPTTSKSTPTKAKDDGQVAVKPKGAADTGEGGVAQAAPVQNESGLGAGVYALGGGGLLAAGGAGAFFLRRRSRA
ncbi:hypothetical protein [Kibdelosporangium aridum]|uniref:LPXTG-motif cell wall anchor domain-containing protein n=1 Tax=Kibdelosporangium aridum TaxID=2030 RepID=A0A1W2CLY5_KIBAR|nr:hypothetical protein [Kibdelosporangium aridum]SMC86229.1 hypothetical protein SAMN05661093_02332 [Kibdelosporangium aridum]